jgi:alkylhydroperoxidase family enzyme
MTARIPPIPFEDWPEELTAGIPAIEGRAGRDDSAPREATQKAKNALGTLAYHPELAKAWLQLNAQVLRKTTLTERQRELLILRVAVLRKSPYQWAEHVPMARRCGLDDSDIARIAYGPDAPFWEPLECALLRSVDELIVDGVISDNTWSVLNQHLEPRQLLDVIFTIGAYETSSWMARSFGVEFDEDLLRE